MFCEPAWLGLTSKELELQQAATTDLKQSVQQLEETNRLGFAMIVVCVRVCVKYIHTYRNLQVAYHHRLLSEELRELLREQSECLPEVKGLPSRKFCTKAMLDSIRALSDSIHA